MSWESWNSANIILQLFMPEAVVGAITSDILHQQKTKEGSLTVTYNKRDIIANTIGHVLAIPTTHTYLWTWNSAFQSPPKELADQLFDRYKDVPWKGDVLVRVGHASILGDIKRMMAKNEHVRGRPWMLKDPVGRTVESVGKLGAVILTTISAIKAKIFRSDFYNPFANSATVYHPKLAPGMHELGHAEWFNQMGEKNRAAYTAGLVNRLFYIPFFRSMIEWKATKNAMTHYKSDAERRQALKIHEAAWATYLGFDALVSMSVFAPAFAIPMIEAAAWGVSGKLLVGKQLITAAYGFALHPYGSAVAGHLMNRLYPKKDQRFGYVFEGKKTDKHIAHEKSYTAAEPKKVKQPELSAHQMLVATARAPKSREVPVEGKGGRQFSDEPLKTGKRPLHSNTSRITF